MGKSILESYSRVLESLAFNIVARIDDLLYVDDLSKHTDKLVPLPKGDRSPYIESSKHYLHGFGVKRIQRDDHMTANGKAKVIGRNIGSLESFPSTMREMGAASPSLESSSSSRGIVSPATD